MNFMCEHSLLHCVNPINNFTMNKYFAKAFHCRVMDKLKSLTTTLKGNETKKLENTIQINPQFGTAIRETILTLREPDHEKVMSDLDQNPEITSIYAPFWYFFNGKVYCFLGSLKIFKNRFG